MSALSWLDPAWPAPPGVRAAFTLRAGGVSTGAFAALNLAAHVGDDPRAVAENRSRLRAALALPAEPRWLTQVHGAEVLDADRAEEALIEAVAGSAGSGPVPSADAAVTRRRGTVLAVLVADCLPVLLARRDGTAVGVAHAGWRGLAAGVLEATVSALRCPGAQLRAWIGPAIGPAHFEVGEEVREALLASADATAAADAFVRNPRGRWQCDLPRLAVQRLAALGVSPIHLTARCTFAEADEFYSFRRDGHTGRMAALIWLANRTGSAADAAAAPDTTHTSQGR